MAKLLFTQKWGCWLLFFYHVTLKPAWIAETAVQDQDLPLNVCQENVKSRSVFWKNKEIGDVTEGTEYQWISSHQHGLCQLLRRPTCPSTAAKQCGGWSTWRRLPPTTLQRTSRAQTLRWWDDGWLHQGGFSWTVNMDYRKGQSHLHFHLHYVTANVAKQNKSMWGIYFLTQ